VPDGDEDLTPEPTTPAIDPAEHANLQLKVALLEAGVDLSTEHGKLVQDAWSGKAPDATAIKTQWEAIRPQTAPTEPPLERLEGEEGQAEERRILAANTTFEPDPTDVDPRAESLKAGREVIAPSDPYGRPGTNADAMATAFHMRAIAAGQGDTRVLVQEP